MAQLKIRHQDPVHHEGRANARAERQDQHSAALPLSSALGSLRQTCGIGVIDGGGRPAQRLPEQFIDRQTNPVVADVGVIDGFAGVMERIGLAARAAFDYIEGTAIPALKDFGTWAVANKDWLLALGIAITTAVVGFQAYTKVMAIWRAAVAVAAAAQVLFNAALTANPIGIIILAIAALVAGLTFFFTQTETGKNLVATAWAAIQTAIAVVVDWWQTSVQPVLTAGWTAITDAATAAATWYTSNVAPVFAAFGELVVAAFDKIAAVVTWLWDTVWKPL